MTIKSDLIAARKLIEKEENWCQGAFVRGNAMCAAEAVRGARAADCITPAYRALDQAIGRGKYHVSDYNDTHTHAEVLELFDRAIAQAGDV